MNEKEIINEIQSMQKKLVHISIDKNDPIQDFIKNQKIDGNKIPFLKRKYTNELAFKVYDVNVSIDSPNDYDNDGYTVILYFEKLDHKCHDSLYYDILGKLYDGMKEAADLSTIKIVITLAKKYIDKKEVKRYLYDALCDNEEYEDEKKITFEVLYVFLFFIVKSMDLKKSLSEDVSVLVDSIGDN